MLRIALVFVLFFVGSVSSSQAQNCPGDCNSNGSVGVSEIILGVRISLGRSDVDDCSAMDINQDGRVGIGELISAVRSALDGCGVGASFADVQAIFDRSCAFVGCHAGGNPAARLDLSAGASLGELVDVEPSNSTAGAMGFSRVEPGNAMNSFLFLKVDAENELDPLLGDRMPRFSPPLPEEEVDIIRSWIDAGASSE